MPPAATLTSKYVCPTPMMIPLVPHSGQGMVAIIMGPPTVLIGKLPAATLGDMVLCVGVPPHPVPIVKGSVTVFINKKPAARMGDLTALGAPIVNGVLTVMIGG